MNLAENRLQRSHIHGKRHEGPPASSPYLTAPTGTRRNYSTKGSPRFGDRNLARFVFAAWAEGLYARDHPRTDKLYFILSRPAS